MMIRLGLYGDIGKENENYYSIIGLYLAQGQTSAEHRSVRILRDRSKNQENSSWVA